MTFLLNQIHERNITVEPAFSDGKRSVYVIPTIKGEQGRRMGGKEQ
jgi:hypothetical protein